MPTWFVVSMGIGTVFVGLICIVILCKITGLFFRTKKDVSAAPTVAAAPATSSQTIENRQEVIAAVSAVLAEELGTDINALRIHSFKKI